MAATLTNLAPGETNVQNFNVAAGVTGEYIVTLQMSDAAYLDPATNLYYALEIQQPDLSWVVYTSGIVQGDPGNGFDKFGNPITPVRQSFTVPASAVAGKTVRGTRRNDGTTTVRSGVDVTKSPFSAQVK